MRVIKLFLLLLPFYSFAQEIISDDIYRFWKAYDKIIVEKDSAKQVNLIQTLYIDNATAGLGGIMKARRYSAEEYVYSINHYPKFWKSIRENTLKSNQFSKEIKNGVDKLKTIYPSLKPVNTYFEIGILRTGGTTIDNMLLIGSEVALADQSVITEEIDKRYPHLRSYFDTNPIKDVVFLNIHEYIHTQQKETIGKNLLAQTMMEGVAEFLSEIALNISSPNPQIEFGFNNEAKIKTEFEKEMFSPSIYNWIMNNPNNQFGMRDLGYFVGYAICKKYYEQASDKKLAVKNMIELDYNNEKELMKFVDKTKYFSKTVLSYKKEFEKKRPFVTGITEIKNGSQNVNSTIKTFTINFSKEMDSNFRNFDYGPLGEDHVLKIKKAIGFSADGKSFSFQADIEPNKTYQLLLDYGFRTKDNYPLIPYLINFKTAE